MIMGFERQRARLAASAQRHGEDAFPAFVRGRTDDQLLRTIGRPAKQRMIFKGMERSFQPHKAIGFVGDIQYVLTGGDAERPWVVRIDGDISTGPGRSADPTVTLQMSGPTLARLVTRDLPPAQAFMEGRIEIDGDLQVAARMGEWFGQATPF